MSVSRRHCCPLREGAVTVKLKEAPQMTRAEYLKAVKQAYPKAISSIYTDYNRGGYLIFDRATNTEITPTFQKEMDAWKSAYEHIKNNGK